MTISEITVKMIEFSQGNLHDINHFLKVHAYARTIGKQEKLSTEQQFILEAAALLHDIACPLCREKYGNTNGKYQEIEGVSLTREFFQGEDLSPEAVERIVFLVSHHHTYTDVDGMDYQILLEADYLVNADESNYSQEAIKGTLEKVFRTETGSMLLQSIYGV